MSACMKPHIFYTHKLCYVVVLMIIVCACVFRNLKRLLLENSSVRLFESGTEKSVEAKQGTVLHVFKSLPLSALVGAGTMYVSYGRALGWVHGWCRCQAGFSEVRTDSMYDICNYLE